VLLTVFVHPYLSVNKPILSKNLVVEAWLSGYQLETIIEESRPFDLEKIFVVGQRFEDDTKNGIKLSDFEKEEYFRWRNKKGVLLLTNSALMVDLSKLVKNVHDSIQTIAVKASDTQKNNVYAHFNMVLGGKWLRSFFVNDSLNEYSFFEDLKWTENLLLSICFDNDNYSLEESRNLFIESVKVNGIEYNLDETNSLITRYESAMTTGFGSEAAQTIQYLEDLKINPNNIEIIEFDNNKKNLTLSAALKLKEHFNESLPKDLNVSSVGLHARRTLFTYRKILEMEQIGVFNVQVKMFDRNNWYKSSQGIQKMIDEFASYIYVWFYLNFIW